MASSSVSPKPALATAAGDHLRRRTSTGNLDSTTGNEILSFMRSAVDEFGQTIVMVTHDPVAASYANRVIFLVDGKIVDELREPTPDGVLDMMKSLGD